MTNTVLLWKPPGITSMQPGLLLPAADPLIKADPNAAVRFLFDLGDALGFSRQATPVNNDPIVDLSGGAPGAFTLGGGQAINYSGGGFDFSAATVYNPGYLSGPAGAALGDIWNAIGAGGGPGGAQLFMSCIYVKLPTAANWSTSASLTDLADGGAPYTSGADLVSIALQASGNAISVRRQKAAATADTFALTPQTADYGGFAQIAFWRNNIGQFARLKTPNGVTWSNNNAGGAAFAKNADNTQNFSAQAPRYGANGAYGNVTTTGLTGLRLYRGFIDNLARENRDPVVLLDTDYRQVAASGRFS